MKMKSFAMLAMSGLLTASLAYIAPAMADDTVEGAAATDALQAAPADALPTTPSSSSTADNTNVGSTGDEGGPDTATGDDDY